MGVLFCCLRVIPIGERQFRMLSRPMRLTAALGIFLSVAACAGGPMDTGEPGEPGSTGDGTADGTDGGIGDPTSASDAAEVTAATGPYFTQPMFFNTDVSTTAKAGNSAAIIASLAAAGGWGNSNKMQIDFTLDVLTATGLSL